MRLTLMRGLTPSFQAGIEFNPLAGKVSPLANWRVVAETAARPALIVGTSSDRIGTPSGQSFYATVSKDVSPWLRAPVAPYIGVAYGTYDDRARAIGGMNVQLPRNISALVIYDGVKVHPTASWSTGPHTLSILFVRGRDPGVSYSVVF